MTKPNCNTYRFAMNAVTASTTAAYAHQKSANRNSHGTVVVNA